MKLKNLDLISRNMCFADLFDPMKRLAEKKKTIESLNIRLCVDSEHNHNWIFREQSNHDWFNMKHFSNLKQVNLQMISLTSANMWNEPEQCSSMELFNVFLSNVETFYMYGTKIQNCDFIKFIPKLSELILSVISIRLMKQL